MATCNRIRSKVTPELAETIRAILSRVEFVPRVSVSWKPGDYAEAKAIAREIADYRGGNSGCISCHFRILNILREAVDLPPIGAEASDSLKARRLAICRGVAGDGSDACKAYHPATDSCGRLVLDAFLPDLVTLDDGRRVQPCGCYLPAKSWIKSERCPASKWPVR